MSTKNDVLRDLIDACQGFALNCKGTTNHCPMALCALAGMGADEARLRDFFAYWREHSAIDGPCPTIVISCASWRSSLGIIDHFSALQIFFRQWIEKAGVDKVLNEVVKVVPFAPASGSFHAMIRLAYGLEAEHLGEIAAGLAALIAGNQPMPSPAGQPVGDARSAFAQLSKELAGVTYPGSWITARMRGAAEDPRFAAALAPVPTANTNAFVDDLARLALIAYWQTRDFTVLHMVTAVHAARLVFLRLSAATVASMLPALWHAVAAAYVTVGAPPLMSRDDALAQAAALGPEGDSEWSTVLTRACLSNSDHVIKLIYTCYEENRLRPDPLYFAVALRASE